MLYDNLPGIDLTIKDGNIVLPAENFGTNTVLIIAPTDKVGVTTVDTTPKLIQSSEDFAKNLLGTFTDKNPLARRWKQVYDAGCRSIYVIELVGATVEERYENLHQMYNILEDSTIADVILLDGVHVDTELDTTKVDLTGIPKQDYIDAAGLSVATGTDTDSVTGTAAKETTLQITNAIVKASSLVVDKKASTEGEATILTLGQDYTYDADLRLVTLVTALELGEVVTASYSVYEYNFADQLAGFCAIVSSKNKQVVGVMSPSLPTTELKSTDLAGIKTYVDAQTMQIHNKFLQVAGLPLMYYEIANTPYYDTFAGSYAGMISILPSYSAPTNKVIPGVLFPVFNLSQSQMQVLTNKHIVIARSKNNRIVVGDAITTAADNSDFVRLTTLRIVNDAVNLIREISDPYIGEPNTLARRNALDTAIRSGLNNMIKRGALNDFRFSIKSSLADQIDGRMNIALDLVPAFETRRIVVTIALKPMLD